MRNIQLAVAAGIAALAVAVVPVTAAQPPVATEIPTTSPQEGQPPAMPASEEPLPALLDGDENPDPVPDAGEDVFLAEVIDTLAPPAADSLATRYRHMMDDFYGQAADRVATPVMDEQAQLLLAQALADELAFTGDQPEVYGQVDVHRPGFSGFVYRAPKEEAEEFFTVADAHGIDPVGARGIYGGSERGHTYGSAAATDERYIYYAFALRK